MTKEEKALIELFKSHGGLWEGHFQLSSGLHSGDYFQCALLLAHPQVASDLGAILAQRFENEKVEIVLGPSLGGIVLAHEVAKYLGCRAFFAERQGDKFHLRRGFKIEPQERVLVVDDVITTGTTEKELMNLVLESGGKVVGVAALVDRSAAGSVHLASRQEALLRLEVKIYPPYQCPLCKAGMPLAVPGSKGVKIP